MASHRGNLNEQNLPLLVQCKTSTRMNLLPVSQSFATCTHVRALIEILSGKCVSLRLRFYVEPPTFHDERPLSSSLVGQSADSCNTIHAFWLWLKTVRGGVKRIMANYNLLSDKLHHYFNRTYVSAVFSIC